ncbi:MAG TPA: type I glyceraldehyde-3-phosphate dehydrogenase [Patescibacteria group bacterium]|nr:type I glyceraldehyde-3-phosphate dehydrogenase [Patescibacteria group bacterium]
MALRIAINGFGRIGRAAFKIIKEKNDCSVVAINDLADVQTLAHLLRYDTTYGRFAYPVTSRENALVVDGEVYPVSAIADAHNLPWKEHNVDVVLECTGHFARGDGAAAHIDAGAQRVVVSAPIKDNPSAETYLIGVNDQHLSDTKSNVVSNASCTTNSVAPVMQVLSKAFGVAKGMVTTVHAYTASQNLHDGPHKDLRLSRAAAQNIIPTTTGAARATAEVLPELVGKFDGMAVRVPVLTVSLTDLTILLQRDVTAKEVNAALISAAASPELSGILGVTDEPVVSSDFIGDKRSSIVDLSLTKVVDGNLVKVVAWYDNEWGYAHRLVELAQEIGKGL